jgi:magnesium chelatase subunit H
LAKRRSNAITITHLTPPLTTAGLYKGLADLKDSLTRWREMQEQDDQRADLEQLIRDQANAVDMNARNIDQLWLKLLETEGSLITEGLHVVGKPLSAAARADMVRLMPSGDASDRAAEL